MEALALNPGRLVAAAVIGLVLLPGPDHQI